MAELIQDFSKLITWSQEYTDFVIESGDGQVFPCHKKDLAENSDFFKSMLSKDFKETTTGVMKVPEFDAKTVALFLAYIYAEKAGDKLMQRIKEYGVPSEWISRRDFDEENYTLPLLKMANMYQLQDLQDDCIKYIQKHITRENAVEAWNVADICGFQKLRESALKFIVQNHKKGAGNQIQRLKEASVRLLNDVLEFSAEKMVIQEGRTGDTDFHLKIVFEEIPGHRNASAGAVVINLNPNETYPMITSGRPDVISEIKFALEDYTELLNDPDYQLLRDGKAMDRTKTLTEQDIQSGETLTFTKNDWFAKCLKCGKWNEGRYDCSGEL